MSKSRSRRASRKPLYLILALSLLLAISYVTLRSYLTPAPLDIDIISTLSYGPVELDGYIQKDAPVGEKGQYLFVAPSTNILVIEAQNLDFFVGSKVHATGTMIPPTSTSGDKNVLQLKTIEILP